MAQIINIVFSPAEGQSVNKIIEDSISGEEIILNVKKRLASSLQIPEDQSHQIIFTESPTEKKRKLFNSQSLKELISENQEKKSLLSIFYSLNFAQRNNNNDIPSNGKSLEGHKEESSLFTLRKSNGPKKEVQKSRFEPSYIIGESIAYYTKLKYKALVPFSLPLSPPLKVSKFDELIQYCDEIFQRISGLYKKLPSGILEIIESMILRLEAHYSSRISGLGVSIDDLILAQTVSFEEFNNQMAYNIKLIEALKVKDSEVSFSQKFLKNSHSTLFSHKPEESPGFYRAHQIHCGPLSCRVDKAPFVPSPPKYIQDSMKKLEEFINEDKTLPILVKICLAFAQLELIRPFGKGNARIARLFVSKLVAQSYSKKSEGFTTFPISFFLLQNRGKLFHLIDSVRLFGDFESLIYFLLEGILDISKRVEKSCIDASKFLQQQHKSVAENENELRFLIDVAHQPVFGDSWLGKNEHELPSEEFLEKKGISQYFTGFYNYHRFLKCFNNLGYGEKEHSM